MKVFLPSTWCYFNMTCIMELTSVTRQLAAAACPISIWQLWHQLQFLVHNIAWTMTCGEGFYYYMIIIIIIGELQRVTQSISTFSRRISWRSTVTFKWKVCGITPLLVIDSFSLCTCCREIIYCLLMSVFFLTCEFVIYGTPLLNDYSAHCIVFGLVVLCNCSVSLKIFR